MRYSTKEDRHSQIKNAIMATSETGVGVYIDLITITSSSSEETANYQIKHGNYFPKEVENGEVLRATWDYFYVDGREDGFVNGFQTLVDVEKFLKEEVERLETRRTEAIISNDNASEGVVGERWGLILEAWQNFQRKFLDAKRNGGLIDVSKAKEMTKELFN